MIRRVPYSEVLGRSQALSQPTRVASDTQSLPPSSSESQHTALARALAMLLSEELRLAPEHIQHVLARELVRVRRARQLVVRVHPDDLALLRAPEHYVATLELEGKLALCADQAISRGGCVLTSNLGEVDAQLETRLSLALTLLQAGAFA